MKDKSFILRNLVLSCLKNTNFDPKKTGCQNRTKVSAIIKKGMDINMAEIIKTYKQAVPAMRFVGKKYGDEDRVNGMFGAKWCEWFAEENKWMDVIAQNVNEDLSGQYEEINDGMALMGHENGVFKYWIGRLTPANTPVPEGFGHVDFPAGSLGACLVYGKEPDVYCREPECCDRMIADGYKMAKNLDFNCFERYASSRFLPDKTGNVTLDICFYVE